MSNTINDQFLDVDFEKCPEFVFGDKGARTFGKPSYEQRFGTLTPREIEEAIDATDAIGGSFDLLPIRTYNQKQEGSCASNATGWAMEATQFKQYGKVIELSPIHLYKRVARTDNGSVISDNWDEIERRGILPLDTPVNRLEFDHVMPHTGFNLPMPGGWESTAIKFAGLEAWPINTLDGLYTAMCSGFPCVVGRDGHAIVYGRLMRSSGRKVAKYKNSWGQWGEDGWGYDSESKINAAARWAFALRAVRAPLP